MAKKKHPTDAPDMRKEPRLLDIGGIYTNKRGEKMRVISRYEDTSYHVVEYLATGNVAYISAKKIDTSWDPSVNLVCGVGYIKSDTPIPIFTGKSKYLLQCWRNMIYRCYSDQERFKAWRGCKVCDEWHNFVNFYEWAIQQKFEVNSRWNLDKDLFSPLEQSLYSPDTCCFLPSTINNQLHKRACARLYAGEGDENLHNICLQISQKLLKYEGVISQNVTDHIWWLCSRQGVSRDRILMMEEAKRKDARISELESALKQLDNRIAELEADNKRMHDTLSNAKRQADGLIACPNCGKAIALKIATVTAT